MTPKKIGNWFAISVIILVALIKYIHYKKSGSRSVYAGVLSSTKNPDPIPVTIRKGIRSEKIRIPSSWNFGLGHKDEITGYLCYFNEDESDAWEEYVPPHKFWGELGYAPGKYPKKLRTVSFSLAPSSPLKESTIEYTLSPPQR